MSDENTPYELGKELTLWSTGGVAPMAVISTPVKPPGRDLMHWQYVTLNNGIPGAVALAISNGKVAIARQWRLPLREYTLEIPRGRGEAGESTIEAASRELLEETGLRAVAAVDLGHLYPDSGTLSAPIRLAVLSVADETGTGDTDGELADWFWLTLDEIDELIVQGKFTDGISLAALQVWRAHGAPVPGE